MTKIKPDGRSESERRSATLSAVTARPRSTSTLISPDTRPRHARSWSTLWSLFGQSRPPHQPIVAGLPDYGKCAASYAAVRHMQVAPRARTWRHERLNRATHADPRTDRTPDPSMPAVVVRIRRIAQSVAVIVAILAIPLSASALARTTRDVVKTRAGAVRGLAHGAYRVFQGIPYAAPPVGRCVGVHPSPRRTGRAYATRPGLAVPARRCR